MAKRTKTLAVMALALACGAVLYARRVPSVERAAEHAAREPEHAASPVHADPAEPRAAPAPDPVCGAGHVLVGGACRPRDPVTQGAYSAAELAKFDAMRATPYIGRHNYFVPAVLTPAEAAKRQLLAARMASLREAIKARQASEAEIEEFFQYRLRLVGYKMQLVTYMHVQAGGPISKHDPELSADDITDPGVRERYDALAAETNAIFEEQKRARLDHGLPAETFLSLAEPFPP
jgi:hypothetical protein